MHAHADQARTKTSQLPFAGIIQIRFKGFSHPAESTAFDLGPLAIYCNFVLLHLLHLLPLPSLQQRHQSMN